MLLIKDISITHFKNYEISHFEMGVPFVGICGKNGVGKTNLLDAVHYSCFAKSHFSATEAMNIGFGKTGFRIETHFMLNDQEKQVLIIQRSNAKKEIRMDGVVCEKINQHAGKFPAVIITPDDLDMINGGGESRRKYLDQLIGLLNPDYTERLSVYNKYLTQRNSLLRQNEPPNSIDTGLLDYYDDQLSHTGDQIYTYRKIHLDSIFKLVDTVYHEISNHTEQIAISYSTKLHERKMADLLKAYRAADLASQRSNVGIHKDDLLLELAGYPFKSTASQGQKKTLLFALKIAEYRMIASHFGFAPLLLLDDVFEKLDQDRMLQLLRQVCSEKKGQVIITDTHRERIEKIMQELDIEGKIIEL